MIGVGGCWAQSVKDQVFRQFPFVDVAFGPGQVHKLAEFLTSATRSPRRASSSSRASRAICPASARASSRPGCRSRSAATAAARTASCRRRAAARCSGRSTSSSPRRSGSPPTACARSRCSARTSTPTGATCGRSGASFSELLRAIDAIDGIERIRYTSPHPKDMREDVILRARGAGVASASTSTCRCSPARAASSRRCAARTPRALPRPRRADPRARARLRADDRHHRRLPGGDRGGLRGDARGRRARSATTARSPSSTRRGAGPRRPSSPTAFVPHEVAVERMERLVEVVQRRARERAQRFVGRTLDVLVEGTSRTDAEPRPRPHAPQQGRQLRRPRSARRDRRGADHERDEPDAHGRDVTARPRVLAKPARPATPSPAAVRRRQSPRIEPQVRRPHRVPVLAVMSTRRDAQRDAGRFGERRLPRQERILVTRVEPQPQALELAGPRGGDHVVPREVVGIVERTRRGLAAGLPDRGRVAAGGAEAVAVQPREVERRRSRPSRCRRSPPGAGRRRSGGRRPG